MKSSLQEEFFPLARKWGTLVPLQLNIQFFPQFESGNTDFRQIIKVTPTLFLLVLW